MKKNPERLSHALHNESVCDFLETKQEFADWIITTAFYSALQFVSYKTFPFEVSSTEGKTTTINTIDQYFNQNNPKRISKHALLGDLVAKRCAEIHADYDWLLDMSMNARYLQYQHPREVAAKARTLMKKIKKHCLPPVNK